MLFQPSYAEQVPGGGDLPIGCGLSLPRWFTFGGSAAGLRYHIDVELSPEGRYRCTHLTLSPGDVPVTDESLREFSVADVLEDAGRVQDVEEEIRWLARSVPDLPDEHTLELVAAVYRYGYAVSSSPTLEVMNRLGLSRSKASRWIAMAREAGFLGQTRERKAGGLYPSTGADKAVEEDQEPEGSG